MKVVGLSSISYYCQSCDVSHRKLPHAFVLPSLADNSPSEVDQRIPIMAPNLAASQHNLIRDMIISKLLKKDAQMAEVARCSTRSIKHIRSNLRCFGTTKAPPNGGGRPRSITHPMLDALREYLVERPDQYLNEVAVFLWDEFGVLPALSTISRTLKSIGWSKKTSRRVAKGRNADLQDFYLHNLSSFRSHHLVYIDESGCDKRIGFRRTGWSPLGVTPVQVARYQREQRYQILPAYTQDGILYAWDGSYCVGGYGTCAARNGGRHLW